MDPGPSRWIPTDLRPGASGGGSADGRRFRTGSPCRPRSDSRARSTSRRGASSGRNPLPRSATSDILPGAPARPLRRARRPGRVGPRGRGDRGGGHERGGRAPRRRCDRPRQVGRRARSPRDRSRTTRPTEREVDSSAHFVSATWGFARTRPHPFPAMVTPCYSFRSRPTGTPGGGNRTVRIDRLPTIDVEVLPDDPHRPMYGRSVPPATASIPTSFSHLGGGGRPGARVLQRMHDPGRVPVLGAEERRTVRRLGRAHRTAAAPDLPTGRLTAPESPYPLQGSRWP